jgi:excisionase family DNA binding protein
MMPITTADAAKRFKVSQRRIQRLIADNRIPGAHRAGPLWLVPDDFQILPAPKRKRHPIKIRTA